MGFGSLTHGQVMKGLLYFAFEIFYFYFFFGFGWQYLKDFGTLGTAAQERVWNEELQIYQRVPGDNSMLILLFGVLTLASLVPFFVLWWLNIKSSLAAQQAIENGKKPNSFWQDLKTLVDERFHITLLSLPMLTLVCFTVLPIIFMILIAFTNFDQSHQPPGNLFTWVGTFGKL